MTTGNNDHTLLIKARRKLFQYSGLNTKHKNKTNSVSTIIFEVFTSAFQINELLKSLSPFPLYPSIFLFL